MKESAEILIRKADKDLEVAKYNLSAGNPDFIDAVCFHSQQAVEKHLKAFIAYNNVEFPHGHNGHDIERLLSICKEIDTSFTELDKVNPSILTDYAVDLRYSEIPIPSMSDAKEAVSIAEEVRSFVLDKVKDISVDKTRDKGFNKNGPELDIDF